MTSIAYPPSPLLQTTLPFLQENLDPCLLQFFKNSNRGEERLGGSHCEVKNEQDRVSFQLLCTTP